MAPRVTIGMPLFNPGALLEGAFDSVFGQSYSDFELLVSDNASTDGTERVCRARAALDGRIRYVRQPTNIGPGPNFGFVLSRARGRYFVWAAHDDRWEPNFLSTLVACLDREQQAVLACCDYDVWMHDTGERVAHASEWMPRLEPTLDPATTVERLLLAPQPTFIYGLFRRDALNRTRSLHRSQFDFSDLALLTEIALVGGIRFVPEVLFHAGIQGEERRPYSLQARRLPGFTLGYGGYARRSLSSIARAPNLSIRMRLVLSYRVVRQTVVLAHWHEVRGRRERRAAAHRAA